MEWWQIQDNIIALTAYMANSGYEASEVAYAVEKPWKHLDVYTQMIKESNEVPE